MKALVIIILMMRLPYKQMKMMTLLGTYHAWGSSFLSNLHTALGPAAKGNTGMLGKHTDFNEGCACMLTWFWPDQNRRSSCRSLHSQEDCLHEPLPVSDTLTGCDALYTFAIHTKPFLEQEQVP